MRAARARPPAPRRARDDCCARAARPARAPALTRSLPPPPPPPPPHPPSPTAEASFRETLATNEALKADAAAARKALELNGARAAAGEDDAGALSSGSSRKKTFAPKEVGDGSSSGVKAALSFKKMGARA